MISRVVERSGDHEHRSRSHQSAGDHSPDDLPLRSGERDGEAVGNRGRRAGLLWKEGSGDGENIKTALKSNGGARRSGGLTERDAGNSPGTGEDTDAHILAATELRDGFHDVAASRHFQNVGAHGRFRVSGYDHGWLGLVLGAGRTAPGAPYDLDGGAVAAGGVGLLRGSGGDGQGAVVFVGGELERVVWERMVLRLKL